LLTIGNSYALDTPFPGSIALVKLGAAVPTPEQSLWMYEQEKQMFRDGANCVLPAATAVVDLTYDELLDKWCALQPAQESCWTGLVRTAVNVPSAGSFTKSATQSGLKLQARSTTTPGVDVSIPSYGLRSELVARAEAAARLAQLGVCFDFSTASFTATTTSGSNVLSAIASIVGTPFIGMKITGTGIPADTTITGINGTTYYLSANATANGSTISMLQADFALPVGYTAREVWIAGTKKQEGSTKDWTRLYDGFYETIRFGTGPASAAWVQIVAVKEV
jgi:hypothetical protein